jgi:DNA-binding NarL/FixJ family response regulator
LGFVNRLPALIKRDKHLHLDGIEATRRIKAKNPKVAVLVLNA